MSLDWRTFLNTCWYASYLLRMCRSLTLPQFMGTEKYPNENDYSAFLNANGGYRYGTRFSLCSLS